LIAQGIRRTDLPRQPHGSEERGRREGDDYAKISGGWKKETGRRNGRSGPDWGTSLPAVRRSEMAAARTVVTNGTPQLSPWETGAESAPNK
jgi:hypothetical protein